MWKQHQGGIGKAYSVAVAANRSKVLDFVLLLIFSAQLTCKFSYLFFLELNFIMCFVLFTFIYHFEYKGYEKKIKYLHFLLPNHQNIKWGNNFNWTNFGKKIWTNIGKIGGDKLWHHWDGNGKKLQQGWTLAVFRSKMVEILRMGTNFNKIISNKRGHTSAQGKKLWPKVRTKSLPIRYKTELVLTNLCNKFAN